MATMTDWELLRRFAREGAQDAFAEVVSRHLNFVYSSARRQVRSPQLVEEVTQAVFLELAQNAGRLDDRTPLTAWLYVVTRRTALNALRTELRRQAREHAAYELTVMNSSPSAWAQVEPLLEETLDDLNAPDRNAVLLRFFENKSLREVGIALGISDDAAQKRVSRALDQLRTLLAKRGVAVTAAGLATDLSAHAVESAPVALGKAISAGSITAGISTAGLETAQAIAMTTLQKAALATVAILVLSAGTYQVRGVVLQERRLTGLENEAARLRQLEATARRDRDERVRQLAVIPAPVQTVSGPTDPDAAVIALYAARISTLRGALAADPRQNIPELQLLTNTDWMGVAAERAVDDDSSLRASLGRLRTVAKAKLTGQFTAALRTYATAHDGNAPFSARELLPNLTLAQSQDTLEPILDRYAIVWKGQLADVPARTDVLVEAESALPDPDYDLQLRIQGFPDPNSPGKFNFGINSKPGRKAVVPQLARPVQP